MDPLKLNLAKLFEQVLGPDTHLLIVADKQPQLIGKVCIRLVVGSCGEENALAVHPFDIVADGAKRLSLSVAKVMAFVDNDQAVACEGWKLLNRIRYF